MYKPKRKDLSFRFSLVGRKEWGDRSLYSCVFALVLSWGAQGLMLRCQYGVSRCVIARDSTLIGALLDVFARCGRDFSLADRP